MIVSLFWHLYYILKCVHHCLFCGKFYVLLHEGIFSEIVISFTVIHKLITVSLLKLHSFIFTFHLSR